MYEYAVIRVVPRVEREEFLNVGVLVFAKQLRQLHCLYALDQARLLAVDPNTDIEMIQKNLQAIAAIASGSIQGGPIATIPAAERFRWLTATRSTLIQTSRVHVGFCESLGEIAQKLFEEYVLI